MKLGIIPAMISPYVVAAMGSRMSHRYMLTGEEFDCAEAFRIGLVHDIAEDEHLNAKIGELLAHLYTSGPNAMAAVKTLIPVSAKAAIGEEMMQATAQLIADLRATPEAQEGLSAFLEKRTAKWTSPVTPAAKRTATQTKPRGSNPSRVSRKKKPATRK